MESNQINPFCLWLSHPRFTQNRKFSGIIGGQILAEMLRAISPTCTEKSITDDKSVVP